MRDVYLANIGESIPVSTTVKEENIEAIIEEEIKESKKTAAPKSGTATTNKNEESIDEILAEEAKEAKSKAAPNSGTKNTK